MGQRQHAKAARQQAQRMERPRPDPAHQRHHGKGRDEGHAIVERRDLAIGQDRAVKRRTVRISGVIDPRPIAYVT
jgi:hypothetical protein